LNAICVFMRSAGWSWAQNSQSLQNLYEVRVASYEEFLVLLNFKFNFNLRPISTYVVSHRKMHIMLKEDMGSKSCSKSYIVALLKWDKVFRAMETAN